MSLPDAMVTILARTYIDTLGVAHDGFRAGLTAAIAWLRSSEAVEVRGRMAAAMRLGDVPLGSKAGPFLLDAALAALAGDNA